MSQLNSTLKGITVFHRYLKSLAYKSVLARRAEGVSVFDTHFLAREEFPQLSGRVIKALIRRADAQLDIPKF